MILHQNQSQTIEFDEISRRFEQSNAVHDFQWLVLNLKALELNVSSIKLTDSIIANIFRRFFIYFHDDNGQILQKFANIICRFIQKKAREKNEWTGTLNEMLQRTKMLDTCFILLAGISLNSILSSSLVDAIACAWELVCSFVMFIMIVSQCECCQNSCIESQSGSEWKKRSHTHRNMQSHKRNKILLKNNSAVVCSTMLR